jgi:hypothetical protein
MAKKNLINADMLLATPRKAAEPVPTEVEIPAIITVITPEPEPQVISEPIVQTPEIVEETPQPVASVKRGLKGNDTRATFIVDENLLEKLKAIAYWERLNIKDVINDTFLSFIESFEKQNGEIKPIPKK